MLGKYKATAVIVVVVATIAMHALFALWSQSLNYAGTPLSDSLEVLISWAFITFAVIASIAIVGPRHERVWVVGFLVLIITAVGCLYVAQIVLARDRYRRDFTSVPIEVTHFLAYLQAIEADADPEVIAAVKEVYGDDWLKPFRQMYKVRSAKRD